MAAALLNEERLSRRITRQRSNHPIEGDSTLLLVFSLLKAALIHLQYLFNPHALEMFIYPGAKFTTQNHLPHSLGPRSSEDLPEESTIAAHYRLDTHQGIPEPQQMAQYCHLFDSSHRSCASTGKA